MKQFGVTSADHDFVGAIAAAGQPRSSSGAAPW
jgi:hypothetical protein